MNKNNYEKSSLKMKNKEKKKKIVSSKISTFARGFRITDDAKLNKCPKCSFDMTQHPIFGIHALEYIIA